MPQTFADLLKASLALRLVAHAKLLGVQPAHLEKDLLDSRQQLFQTPDMHRTLVGHDLRRGTLEWRRHQNECRHLPADQRQRPAG